ncbi:MAG TPA: hypothetical protein VLE89_03810 [Chlamydiales bacterium]|nr:hypothetical protein [Chlamydiales bacterium]
MEHAAKQAYGLLRFVFIVIPIVAGLDKFFHLLVNWEQYLSPMAMNMLGGHGSGFMMAVGVIEIIAGLGVWFKPKIFSYIVALWLALIIVNLITLHNYYDVAARDLGLCLSALALGRLSSVYAK